MRELAEDWTIQNRCPITGFVNESGKAHRVGLKLWDDPTIDGEGLWS